MLLHYEDLHPGAAFETSGATMTEEAIIRFAMEWDFQPFHVDREAAKSSIFGKLVASGLHTIVLTFRLCNQAGIFAVTSVAGIGFDRLRFHAPVPAGSTLRARAVVEEMRASAGHPDAGIVRWGIETRDEHDRLVLSLALTQLLAKRQASPSSDLAGRKARTAGGDVR